MNQISCSCLIKKLFTGGIRLDRELQFGVHSGDAYIDLKICKLANDIDYPLVLVSLRSYNQHLFDKSIATTRRCLLSRRDERPTRILERTRHNRVITSTNLTSHVCRCSFSDIYIVVIFFNIKAKWTEEQRSSRRHKGVVLLCNELTFSSLCEKPLGWPRTSEEGVMLLAAQRRKRPLCSQSTPLCPNADW